MRWDQEPLPIFMDSKIGWFDSPVVHSHFGSYFNIVNILISIGFFLLYDFFFFLRAYYFDMKTPLALPFHLLELLLLLLLPADFWNCFKPGKTLKTRLGGSIPPMVHSHFGSYFNIVNILISIGFFLLYDFFFFLRAYYL